MLTTVSILFGILGFKYGATMSPPFYNLPLYRALAMRPTFPLPKFHPFPDAIKAISPTQLGLVLSQCNIEGCHQIPLMIIRSKRALDNAFQALNNAATQKLRELALQPNINPVTLASHENYYHDVVNWWAKEMHKPLRISIPQCTNTIDPITGNALRSTLHDIMVPYYMAVALRPFEEQGLIRVHQSSTGCPLWQGQSSGLGQCGFAQIVQTRSCPCTGVPRLSISMLPPIVMPSPRPPIPIGPIDDDAENEESEEEQVPFRPRSRSSSYHGQRVHKPRSYRRPSTLRYRTMDEHIPTRPKPVTPPIKKPTTPSRAPQTLGEEIKSLNPTFPSSIGPASAVNQTRSPTLKSYGPPLRRIDQVIPYSPPASVFGTKAGCPVPSLRNKPSRLTRYRLESLGESSPRKDSDDHKLRKFSTLRKKLRRIRAKEQLLPRFKRRCNSTGFLGNIFGQRKVFGSYEQSGRKNREPTITSSEDETEYNKVNQRENSNSEGETEMREPSIVEKKKGRKCKRRNASTAYDFYNDAISNSQMILPPASPLLGQSQNQSNIQFQGQQQVPGQGPSVIGGGANNGNNSFISGGTAGNVAVNSDPNLGSSGYPNQIFSGQGISDVSGQSGRPTNQYNVATGYGVPSGAEYGTPNASVSGLSGLTARQPIYHGSIYPSLSQGASGSDGSGQYLNSVNGQQQYSPQGASQAQGYDQSQLGGGSIQSQAQDQIVNQSQISGQNQIQGQNQAQNAGQIYGQVSGQGGVAVQNGDGGTSEASQTTTQVTTTEETIQEPSTTATTTISGGGSSSSSGSTGLSVGGQATFSASGGGRAYQAIL